MTLSPNRSQATLTVSDLAPMRRMLGSESLVVRVDPDQTLHPPQLLPELFLGPSLRRLLDPAVRATFDQACSRAVADLETVVFALPDPTEDGGEIVIAPVVDSGPDTIVCRFLLCWARSDSGRAGPCGDQPSAWHELDPDEIVVRYRCVGPAVVEAGPWWNRPSCGPVDLWAHHERVASVGLGLQTMAVTLAGAVDALDELDAAGRPDASVRIEAPAPDMLAGIVPILAGMLRGSGIEAGRLTIRVPVEMAVDPDVLPLVLHIQNLGVNVDLVGLDHLTASLRRVTGLAPGPAPASTVPVAAMTGPWVHSPRDLANPAASA